MKIAIIGPAHPLRGGIAALNERLAQAFVEQGHQVIIYSFSLQYPSFLFPGKTQLSPDPAPKHLDIRTRINSISPLNWWKVGNDILRDAPDVAIVRYWLPFMAPSLGSILRVLRRRKATTIIALADNIIPHEKRLGDRQLTQYFVGSLDGCVAMSRSVANDFRTFSAHLPVAYTPHPIYDTYGKPVARLDGLRRLGLDKKYRYVLFFGFIRRYKGLDILLEAMADPRVEAANIHVIVAGEYYDQQQFYEQLIETGKLRERVHVFAEFIPSDEVRYYFGAADLVVQPYRTATQSGISQMAYHFEKPMLVSNVGGLPEIVANGRSGYVVSPEPNMVAAAILDFYENDRSADFIAHVKEEKQRFAWETMTTVFEEMHREIKASR